MKVKDLHVLDGFWDVYENIADLIQVTFSNDGKEWLTEEGKKEFKKVLNVEIERIDNNMILIDTESIVSKEESNKYSYENNDDCPKIIQELARLFWSYAGYCNSSDWDKWFIKK